MTRRPAVEFVVIFALAVGLYAPRLSTMPPYLWIDEAFFAITAHSIAMTGHDVKGVFLPLYFQIRPGEWFQPAIVYFTALFVKWLPLTEWTVRLPSLVLGLLDVALMYLIARRLFAPHRLALVATAMLMLTPAHFILSRVAMDYLYPVPFTLAWLFCLVTFLQKPRAALIGTATTVLGFGFFSYLASAIMMPLYFGMTLIVLLRTPSTRRLTYIAAATIGFLVPLVLLVWLVGHPQTLTDTLIRYRIYEQGRAAVAPAPVAGIWRGIRAFLHLEPISQRLSLYWTFFSPSYLFLTGGGNFSCSTGRSGVFLLTTAPFLVLGINRIVNVRRTQLDVLLLAAFVLAPIAALVVNDPYAIQREAGVMVFVVLIATIGVEAMWSSSHRWRICAACLLVLMPIQFAYFYTDYFTGYRVRSAFWFGDNLAGAMESLIELEPADSKRPVFLSNAIPHEDWYWRLYLAKHQRPELLERTVYFDPMNPPDTRTAPPGTLVLGTVDDEREAKLTKGGAFRRVRTILDPDGTAFFGVFQR